MVSRLSAIDILMGVSVALIWGMGFVFSKAAIAHFPPILLMAFRFSVTALALVWFVRPPLAHIGRLALIAFIASAVQYSLTFTGLKGLDASVAVLVVQLEVPFLVLIGAVALRERPGLRKWLGIALAFAGVALIAGEPSVASAWVSVLLVVSGAFVWAVGQAMIRALEDIDGLTVTAWIAVCAAPQLFVMSLIFETGHVAAIRSADWVVWGTVVYLGLVMTALGYGMWNVLVRRHPVSQVAPFLLLLPVFSILASGIFLGEVLTAQSLAGGAVVIAGLAVILVERWPLPRTAVAAVPAVAPAPIPAAVPAAVIPPTNAGPDGIPPPAPPRKDAGSAP
ncbi:EamA family transporter [Maritimibacter sp. 55A14]|uniref:DMT family transporter n=1 Tax=Maritimibacter sp. 55A14 TaxID=2174844 RepID=UPI000D61B221|nr:EamA family transporter [Maritimibacter sp. 55A14]PWE32633.1 EamA family transporter [Maritimibacter sp. 55A14]